MPLLRILSLAIATLTTGLTAGFFYAYACSVTLGTARLDDAGYIATMQSINATVRNPAFAFGFFGALIALIAAAAAHVRAGWSPRTALILAALASYAAGCVALTFAISVPLNQELAGVSLAASPEALARARRDYEGPWNTWNLARTAFSTVALLMLIAASLLQAPRRATAETARDGGAADQAGAAAAAVSALT